MGKYGDVCHSSYVENNFVGPVLPLQALENELIPENARLGQCAVVPMRNVPGRLWQLNAPSPFGDAIWGCLDVAALLEEILWSRL